MHWRRFCSEVFFAAEIAKLRSTCRLILKEQHDDIFLLRYILSYGSAEKSREAVAFAVDWLARPANRFFMEKLERGEELALIAEMQAMGLRMVGLHNSAQLDGGPVQLVRQGLLDMDALLDCWTHEEMGGETAVLKCGLTLSISALQRHAKVSGVADLRPRDPRDAPPGEDDCDQRLYRFVWRRM